MQSQITSVDLKAKNRLIVRSSSPRAIKDKLTHFFVSLGGGAVFVALLLIFFYLLYVIKPLFDSAEITPVASVKLTAPSPALLVGSDEQNRFIYRVSEQGQVDFYRIQHPKQIATSRAEWVSSARVALPEGINIVSRAVSTPSKQLFALGLSNGEVMIAGVNFGVNYLNAGPQVSPSLALINGGTPFVVDADGRALKRLSFDVSPLQISFVYQVADNRWYLTRFNGELDMANGEVNWSRVSGSLNDVPLDVPLDVLLEVQQQIMTPDQRQFLLRSADKLYVYDIRDEANISLKQVVDLSRSRDRVRQIDLLAGASSLLVGYDSGLVVQYFQVAGAKGKQYRAIRDFSVSGKIAVITSEFYRKSFVTLSDQGQVGLFYTSSERELLSKNLALDEPVTASFSPSGNGLIVETASALYLFSVTNAHPEISWSALWNKVWYEGYPQPEYVWQSSSATADFEAKLSLMPLIFGTLKAALYAMLFATPLAVAGAIYTAYFMSSRLRSVVKPTIEMMEALPTVILGFLAGLWLAPLIETHLTAILLLSLSLPLSILGFGVLCYCLPERWQAQSGMYRELLLIPVIIGVAWLAFSLGPIIESWLFGGDARQFMTHELGINFDQRNALVVGIAMGFAVIPTIFTLTEDAVFSVPRHLSNASLALGATRWQTLIRVVLLTASPGIFSAVMMGLGRAVGETMIVLMATGNTPIMEWNVFEGMRTLAANIAVEVPESTAVSSHYRVLFLAAFVLFVFTFIFNTIAEVVRQRLRARYSRL